MFAFWPLVTFAAGRGFHVVDRPIIDSVAFEKTHGDAQAELFLWLPYFGSDFVGGVLRVEILGALGSHRRSL